MSKLRNTHAVLKKYATPTKIDKRKYLREKGSVCPFCGSRDLDAEDPEVDGPTGSVEVTCGNCQSSWNDVYTLSDISEETAGDPSEMKTPAKAGYPLASK